MQKKRKWDIQIRPLDDLEIETLYQNVMQKDFPPSELKPLATILSLKHQNVYDVFGAWDEQGHQLAYAMLYIPHEGDLILLDYLAVAQEWRNMGVGSTVLARLCDHYIDHAQALLVECEHPEEASVPEEAQRRIRFYTGNGACLTSVKVLLFDVVYDILVFPYTEQAEGRDWAQAMLDLYRTMLSPTMFEENVQLLQ